MFAVLGLTLLQLFWDILASIEGPAKRGEEIIGAISSQSLPSCRELSLPFIGISLTPWATYLSCAANWRIITLVGVVMIVLPEAYFLWGQIIATKWGIFDTPDVRHVHLALSLSPPSTDISKASSYKSQHGETHRANSHSGRSTFSGGSTRRAKRHRQPPRNRSTGGSEESVGKDIPTPVLYPPVPIKELLRKSRQMYHASLLILVASGVALRNLQLPPAVHLIAVRCLLGSKRNEFMRATVMNRHETSYGTAWEFEMAYRSEMIFREQFSVLSGMLVRKFLTVIRSDNDSPLWPVLAYYFVVVFNELGMARAGYWPMARDQARRLLVRTCARTWKDEMDQAEVEAKTDKTSGRKSGRRQHSDNAGNSQSQRVQLPPLDIVNTTLPQIVGVPGAYMGRPRSWKARDPGTSSHAGAHAASTPSQVQSSSKSNVPATMAERDDHDAKAFGHLPNIPSETARLLLTVPPTALRPIGTLGMATCERLTRYSTPWDIACALLQDYAVRFVVLLGALGFLALVAGTNNNLRLRATGMAFQEWLTSSNGSAEEGVRSLMSTWGIQQISTSLRGNLGQEAGALESVKEAQWFEIEACLWLRDSLVRALFMLETWVVELMGL